MIHIKSQLYGSYIYKYSRSVTYIVHFSLRMPGFDTLCHDVFMMLCIFVDFKDVLVFSRVCRRFRERIRQYSSVHPVHLNYMHSFRICKRNYLTTLNSFRVVIPTFPWVSQQAREDISDMQISNIGRDRDIEAYSRELVEMISPEFPEETVSIILSIIRYQ